MKKAGMDYSVWPPVARGALVKPSRTASKIARHLGRQKRAKDERDNKAEVRRRDKHCRFPLCGCRKLGLRLEARQEVSHDTHKGMGGNPAGDRSAPERMIFLCLHRHQDGAISRHKGTLRTRYLTDRGNAGPVAWQVRRVALFEPEVLAVVDAADLPRGEWVEVAREVSRGQVGELAPWQRAVLDVLAQMNL